MGESTETISGSPGATQISWGMARNWSQVSQTRGRGSEPLAVPPHQKEQLIFLPPSLFLLLYGNGTSADEHTGVF